MFCALTNDLEVIVKVKIQTQRCSPTNCCACCGYCCYSIIFSVKWFILFSRVWCNFSRFSSVFCCIRRVSESRELFECSSEHRTHWEEYRPMKRRCFKGHWEKRESGTGWLLGLSQIWMLDAKWLRAVKSEMTISLGNLQGSHMSCVNLARVADLHCVDARCLIP